MPTGDWIPPILNAAPVSEPRVLTPADIAIRELGRAEQALEDAEYEEIKAAAQASREAKHAEIAARKAAWTDEERARALAAVLRGREERPVQPTRPADDHDDDDEETDPEVEAIARAEGCDDAIDIARGEV